MFSMPITLDLTLFVILIHQIQNVAHLERMLYLCLISKTGDKIKVNKTITTREIVAPTINNSDLMSNIM
jgi:hypothetical protein